VTVEPWDSSSATDPRYALEESQGSTVTIGTAPMALTTFIDAVSSIGRSMSRYVETTDGTRPTRAA